VTGATAPDPWGEARASLQKLELATAGINLNPRINLAVALILFCFSAAALLTWTFIDSPAFHTILDTSVLLANVMLALLLLDIASRTPAVFPRLLAICYFIATIGEFGHTLAALETLSGVIPGGPSEIQWRAGTWGVPAHILPISLCAALLLRHRGRKVVWPFVLAIATLTAAALFLYLRLPRYSAPGLLGITRPTLALVPFFWIAVGVGYWRARKEGDVMYAIALMAVIMTFGHIAMLYSRAPNDGVAMVAHTGKLIGKLYLLMCLMQIGAAAMVQRIRAERALQQLNQDLERRVGERTQALQAENTLRRQAEQKLQTQLDRLNLLNQITRAIGERQDLPSIFQVVIRSLEDQLPIDFACMCLYDNVERVLTVSNCGVKSRPLALSLAMPERAKIEIDENGLSRCVRGELVYEPDIEHVKFPFPERLARGGLRALVISPLINDGFVFGVMVTARREANSFSSSDCEFLKQLSEHVALATRQAQLHNTLQRAYDDLRQTQQIVMQQERLRAIGQMASGIAHDINNAISPASLYVQSLLESESGLSERGRAQLTTIQRVINDVSATVARMREFYRQRESDTALAPVDLNQVVQQMIEFTRARWNDIPQRIGIAITVHADLDADLPLATGIDNEIREALTNLIFNAVDAMPEGGRLMLRTSIEEYREAADGTLSKRIRLEVSDTGTGMDEATRGRCLEPFFTTKGERGTGLGLAMVYGVAQRHGAEIEIDSTMGKGTTIRLIFPVPKHTESAPAAVDVAPVDLPPMRILLVDDDPFVLDSMCIVLELDGHAIVTAEGGQVGIDAFREAQQSGEPFAAVITDLGMPNVDGNQVARAIKALSPSTPVILLTGWGRRLDQERDAPSHIDLTLSKPPQLDDLRKALLHCSKLRANY
jgi:signal transduction histidine kinase/CheY-like chemotaxis protein